jgi:hypothetical protein
MRELLIDEIGALLPDILLDLLHILRLDLGPCKTRQLVWVFGAVTTHQLLMINRRWIVMRVLVLNIPIVAELRVYLADMLLLETEPIANIEIEHPSVSCTNWKTITTI